jgi:four helix bundle protein
MSSGVRELRVWQESVALAGDVIRSARQGMRRETKSVSDALMATGLAIATHIAEGYGGHTVADQRDSYLAAKRALLRLETELAVARHADLLPSGSFTELTTRSSQVARLLSGYLVYLEREITERAGSAGGDGQRRRPRAPGEPTTPDSDRVPS